MSKAALHTSGTISASTVGASTVSAGTVNGGDHAPRLRVTLPGTNRVVERAVSPTPVRRRPSPS